MADGSVVLCLDVGGSSVKSGAVLDSGRVVVGPHLRRIRSRGSAREVVGGLAAALSRLREDAADREVLGIGVAMPGPFDYQRGVSLMEGIGKFDKIRGVALAEEVTKRAPSLSGLGWRWINDARAFALGELRFGAAVGAERAMFLTLGTGCGSAFAVDGRLVTEGAEVPTGGYVYALQHDGRSVDELLSSRGLVRLWREQAARVATDVAPDLSAGATADAAAHAAVRAAAHAAPSRRRPSALHVGRLADDGDPAALEAFRLFGRSLAAALAPVFASFRPDLVVMGGRVSRSLNRFGPAAMAAGAPRLVAAAAPDLAALRGAAVHFLEQAPQERG